MNHQKKGPFIAEDNGDALSVLFPHLTRAMQLQEHVLVVEHQRDMAFAALDSLPVGIFIVDDTCRVEYANAMAYRLCGEDDGLRIDDGVLRTRRIEDWGRLAAIIRSVRQDQPIPGELITLRRPSGQPPLHLVVRSFVRERLRQHSPGGPQAVIFATDHEHDLEIPADVLQQIFGLSRAQSRLVECLAAGDSLKEAAARLNLSEGSARQYLKAIFAKTGTRSQSDLIRRLAVCQMCMMYRKASSLPQSAASCGGLRAPSAVDEFPELTWPPKA
jgi:DNA-binding CsgD family transcriptional regulator